MSSGLASNANEFFPAGQSGDTSVTRADRLAWLLQDISRRIVASMNGSMGFDTQVGRGTTFWVDFPVAADA